MDPVLQDILLDGVTKYLTGTRQTKYVVNSSCTQHRQTIGIVFVKYEEIKRKQRRIKKMNTGNYKEIRRRSVGITCYEKSSSKTGAN